MSKYLVLLLLHHIENATSEEVMQGIQIEDVSLVPIVSGIGSINVIQGFKYGIVSKRINSVSRKFRYIKKQLWY